MRIIELSTNNNETIKAEVLASFRLKDFGKDYIIYTIDSNEENENVKIMASTLKKENDKYLLDNIQTEEEWARIKKIIKGTIHNELNREEE